MDCRAGENEKNWFRSERIYCIDGKWYFTTREGDEIGPFHSHDQANREIQTFLTCLKKDGLLAAEYFTKMRMQVGTSRV